MITLILLDPQTERPLRQWHFQNKAIIRIGRQGDNDVVLDSYSEVSRHHLELRQETQAWRLISQGANGTFVNGTSINQVLITGEMVVQLARGGPRLRVSMQPDRSANCAHANNPPEAIFCIHCGEPIVSTNEFVRQYQVLRILGQGGMGTTYLAWDKQGTLEGRPLLLVLKQMNADMVKIDKAKELFEREAKTLKTLNHPGIPRYYDFFVEKEKKYLAMEYVRGENLEQRIYQKGPVPLHQAVTWMLQVCEILAYLHSLNPPLVHRDVKPANLISRAGDDRVILLDFGAVKEVGTAPGTRIGAEGYSAPEQDRGQPVPQSDLYAIGPTLTFLLTGESPLKYYRRKGNEYRLCVGDIPTITPELRVAIEKASEPRLSDRYQNVEELAAVLQQCL